jgi:sugar (pentulose or hexulose) kinase
MLAPDITSRPLLAVKTSEASLGSAMLALHSHENGVSLSEIAQQVVEIRKNFVPREDACAAYRAASERFATITERLYGSR